MIATPELHPKTLDLLKEFEGKPRLKARLCEGGRYEVAYGVTYYPDGRPVGADDVIAESDVMPMTLHALANEAAPVWAALTRPVTPAQAGALAVLAFNVGGGTVAKSIREQSFRAVNEGRYEDAAAAFGLYTAATSSGPSPTEVAAGIAPNHPPWKDFGRGPRWLSPEGNPCAYFRRFRGLLRRHHAEGCLFLGLDWKEATKNDAISMALDPVWNAAKSRWEDKIIRQTEFAEVLEIARRYPLAGIPIASEPDPPKPAAPVVPVDVKPLPEILPEPPKPKPVEKPVTASPPAPPKPVVVPPGQLPNDFDPNGGVKAMVYSRRFWGWVLIVLGRFSFVTDGSAHWAAQAGGSVGQVANMVAADPLLLDAWTGMAVMFVGEGVRWWGEKKAKKVLV